MTGHPEWLPVGVWSEQGVERLKTTSVRGNECRRLRRFNATKQETNKQSDGTHTHTRYYRDATRRYRKR